MLMPMAIDTAEASAGFVGESAIQNCQGIVANPTGSVGVNPELTTGIMDVVSVTSFEGVNRPLTGNTGGATSTPATGPQPTSGPSVGQPTLGSSLHPSIPTTADSGPAGVASTVVTAGESHITLTAGQAPTAVTYTDRSGQTRVTVVIGPSQGSEVLSYTDDSSHTIVTTVSPPAAPGEFTYTDPIGQTIVTTVSPPGNSIIASGSASGSASSSTTDGSSGMVGCAPGIWGLYCLLGHVVINI
jgi:hypothetical protein